MIIGVVAGTVGSVDEGGVVCEGSHNLSYGCLVIEGEQDGRAFLGVIIREGDREAVHALRAVECSQFVEQSWQVVWGHFAS